MKVFPLKWSFSLRILVDPCEDDLWNNNQFLLLNQFIPQCQYILHQALLGRTNAGHALALINEQNKVTTTKKKTVYRAKGLLSLSLSLVEGGAVEQRI